MAHCAAQVQLIDHGALNAVLIMVAAGRGFGYMTLKGKQQCNLKYYSNLFSLLQSTGSFHEHPSQHNDLPLQDAGWALLAKSRTLVASLPRALQQRP